MDTHHCSHRCLNFTSCQVSWSIRFLEEQGFYCTWIIWKPSAPLLPWVHRKITWCTLHISSISRVIKYSLDVLLFLFGTVCCSMSSSNCCFLTCIQISQEASQVVWYSHLFQNFPQFMVIHIVKGFSIVNKAEIDVFLELLLFPWSSRCWQFDLWFLCLF